MDEIEFIDLQIKLLNERKEKLLLKQKLDKPPVIIVSESPKDEEDNHHNYKRADCCGRRILKCDCDMYDLRKYSPNNFHLKK